MPLFDLHCDTLYKAYTKKYPLSENDGHIDLRRAVRYEPYVQTFAVWIPENLRGDAAWDFCCRVLAYAERLPVRFWRKGEPLDDCLRAHTMVGMLAVEGGTAIEGDIARIDTLAAWGVRYITLTWNDENALGNGCLSSCREGLTPLGKAAVRRMEEAGVTVDVSHLNEAGFWDVAAMAGRPFIAGHSNAAAVCPHPRNLTDQQFQAIVASGGLVGINLFADFLGEPTFEAVERHLYHFWECGGENTVAFGADFDGAAMPASWNGVAVMEPLFEFLYRKNYDSDLLSRLFFSNCYNFFRRL